jgi:hypothetical protein
LPADLQAGRLHHPYPPQAAVGVKQSAAGHGESLFLLPTALSDLCRSVRSVVSLLSPFCGVFAPESQRAENLSLRPAAFPGKKVEKTHCWDRPGIVRPPGTQSCSRCGPQPVPPLGEEG